MTSPSPEKFRDWDSAFLHFDFFIDADAILYLYFVHLVPVACDFDGITFDLDSVTCRSDAKDCSVLIFRNNNPQFL